MRKHPVYGAEFVSRIPFLQGARDIIENHHERWDGAGYPRGLRAEAIPIAARVFSVCDTYDAITSRRCYKEPLPHSFAIEEIRRCAGTQFDPAVVDAFERIVDFFPKAHDARDGMDLAPFVDERAPLPSQPVRNGA
jgi:HD-GYP domain-containing protein (c-di-GMP phosphodiesterase class II)